MWKLVFKVLLADLLKSALVLMKKQVEDVTDRMGRCVLGVLSAAVLSLPWAVSIPEVRFKQYVVTFGECFFIQQENVLSYFSDTDLFTNSVYPRQSFKPALSAAQIIAPPPADAGLLAADPVEIAKAILRCALTIDKKQIRQVSGEPASFILSLLRT